MMPEQNRGLFPRQGYTRRDFLQKAGLGAAGGLALFAASGCGSGNSKASGSGKYSGSVPIAQLSTVVVGAAFYTARAKGFFQNEALDLKLVDGGGGTGVLQALRAPDADFGMVPATGVITAFAKGARDLRIFSGFAKGSIIEFIVPSDSPINDPNDIRPGMKIGTSSPASVTTLHAHAWVRQLGFAPQDLEIIFVGGPAEAFTAAKDGIVDVAWSPIPFSTGLVEKKQARVIVRGPEIIDDWRDGVLVTTQDFIEEQPETLRSWRSALGSAIDLIRKDRGEAAATWAKAINMDPSVTTAALERVGKDQDYFDLSLDREAIQKAVGYARELGSIDEEEGVDLDTLIAPGNVGGSGG